MRHHAFQTAASMSCWRSASFFPVAAMSRRASSALSSATVCRAAERRVGRDPADRRDVWVSSGRAVKARARQQGEATTQRSPNQGQLTHHLTDALLGQPLWLCSGAPLGVAVGIALLLVSVIISLTTRGAAARTIALGTVLRLERGRDFPEGHVAARVERGRVDGRHPLCLSAVVCPCGV